MDTQSNSINWFEIPATDINRAKTFYETIFNIEMQVQEMTEMGMTMANFPYEMGSGKATGAVVQSQMHQPATEGGPVLYLNASPSIDAVIERIENAGGQIAMPKTKINDEIGYMAFFVDSEGNKMALHLPS